MQRSRLSLALVPLVLASCTWSHGREDPSDAASVLDARADEPDAHVVRQDAGRADAGTACRAEPASPPPSACDPALCGDGARGTCSTCVPCVGPGDPPRWDGGVDCCTTQQEACDGDDLGGASCESLGYAGGVLRCGDWCGLDTSACDACASAASIVACGRADVDPAPPGSLALATREGEIGVAWTSRPAPDGSSALHFARFSAGLTRIAESACLGTHDASRVALAASPSGWIVAAGTASGIEVLWLDAGGAARAAHTIDGGAVPLLAGRPDGGPLLVYVDRTSRSSLRAALVLEEGAPLWQTTLFDGVIEAEYGSAVYTGDGFLVAQRGYDGAAVVRVELDSRVSAVHAFPGSATEYPQLAWNGARGRLTWADFAGTPVLRSAAVDRTGAAVGPTVRVGSAPADYNPAPLVALANDGDDMAVLLPGYTGWTAHGQHVGVVRLDPSGAARAEPVIVARDPQYTFDMRIARLDGDPSANQTVILAWLSDGYPGGIHLARVNP